ncbi:MAG TPA: YceI family protein [Flavipsychrobacter sp.]|nr:YceI family protein [Flavipsychrobacter sp.]
MKKSIMMMTTALLLCNAVFAQKYMTRTGKVSFFSGTPIENIEAFNNEASSVMDAQSGSVVYQVPVKSFKFENGKMQEHFNENYMESDKYPRAEFKGKITDVSKVNFSKDGTYNVTTSGKMTIHGVTKDVSIPGTITVKGSEATMNSKFRVKTADYGIKIPSVVEGKIAKEIEVTVNSVLKRQ